MVLEEKANALKSIQQQIMDANENGKVPADIAKTIDTQIKYHLQDASNWLAFKEAFEKIHPTFSKSSRTSIRASANTNCDSVPLLARDSIANKLLSY